MLLMLFLLLLLLLSKTDTTFKKGNTRSLASLRLPRRKPTKTTDTFVVKGSGADVPAAALRF